MINVKIIKKPKGTAASGIITAGAPSTSNLYNLIAAKLDRSEFDELFEKITLPSGRVAIRAKYGLYSEEFMSVLGANPDAGDGTLTAGATTLGGLTNVVAAADEVQGADRILVREMGASGWTLKNLSDVVGLNTAALQQYLTVNNYAKMGDIPSLAGYATEQWVGQQGFATESWVNGRGFLTEHQSLDAYLTKTEAASTYQPIGDYAMASALNSAVSSLTTAIGGKLDAAKFDELFEKVTLASGKVAIKAKYGLYSEAFMSVLGVNPDAGDGTVVGGGVDLDAVQSYLTQQGYATEAWVNSQGFLKSVSGFLPLTGGELSGRLSIITGQNECGIRFGGNTAADDFVGRFGTYMSLYNHIGNAEIKLYDNKTVAITGSSLTFNGTPVLTAHQSLDNYVDKTSAEDVGGVKTFTANVTNITRRLCVNGDTTEYAAYPEVMLHIPNTDWAKFKLAQNGVVHLLRGGDTNWTQYTTLKASSFVRNGGTSSQFLKADGSVDGTTYVSGNYVICDYGTPTLKWEWGGNLTHVVGFESSNANTLRVYSGASIRAFANAVNKAGDTMTGALTVPKLNVLGTANSSAYITADSAENLYINIAGKSLLVVNNEPAIRAALGLSGLVSLGTSAVRWANVYANTINVSSTALVSNLNADLLDGCHGSDFVRRYTSLATAGATVSWEDWLKANGSNVGLYTRGSWSWAQGAIINIGSWAVNTESYAALVYRQGYLNGSWAMSAAMFLPAYGTEKYIYLVRANTEATAGTLTNKSALRFADYDTVLASNVASATKLQTAKKIYGVDFDGTGHVNGAFHWMGSDATLRIYEIASTVNSSFGNETIGIQSCFDGEDGLTSAFPSTWANRCLIALQPRGGRVAIGQTSAAYPLDVNGDIQAKGWVRTTGDNGWYNQTHGGGWHMSDGYWVRAWAKPVKIGYVQNVGANSFGVGLCVENANNTSVEVVGGDYTMGLGCHKNGEWCWWRGTASGKSYVMQYNGSLWNFTGEIKASTGVYSDGYMSCLGQNTGSDARLKSHFRPLTLPIETIINAPCGAFVWNEKAGEVMCGRRAVGTIAQYWLDPLPAVVGTMPTGYYSMDYDGLDWVAVHSVAQFAYNGIANHERRLRAVEDALKENGMLRKENSKLRKENDDLKKYIAKLEGRNVA